MNEGDFRILAALKGGPLSRTELIRQSGEAHSVLSDLERRKGKFFDHRDRDIALSTKGQEALRWEENARDTSPLGHAELVAALKSEAAGRPGPRRDLDQVHATYDTVARRARRLVEHGEAQRGLLFLGDDDLTSLAVTLLLRAQQSERRVRVLDIDERLIAFLQDKGIDAEVHDLREPLGKLRGKFGCVFTDPPYANEGFRLFVHRGASALKGDGRLWIAFGSSRRAPERLLQKQRVLLEVGLAFDELWPGFNHYEGAESIGSRSDLYVVRRTPMTRPDENTDASDELYTRRKPQ